MPLPAPATLQLLRGQPVRSAGSDRELVTPTGAAIATEVAQFGVMPEMTIDRIGYGVGGWQLDDRPNLLRGIVGTADPADGFETDVVTVLETHLDDSPPEWLGALIERLMRDGALDAVCTPLYMKKNRPGTSLRVVARPHDAQRLAGLVLSESSAIGVRMHETRRLKLRRQTVNIEMGWGTARVKLIFQGEQLLRITPEFDSCRQLGEATGRPLPEVYRLVTAAAQRRFGLES